MENKKWTRKEAEQIKEHKYEQPSIEISDSELTFEECEDSSDDDWENWENSPNEFFDDDEDATGCKKLNMDNRDDFLLESKKDSFL